MSVAQTTQNFIGITNENEFYGHHYLSEVFKGDIRSLIEGWLVAEETAQKGETDTRAPFKRLNGLGGKWFASLSGFERNKEDTSLIENHKQLHAPILEALGYQLKLQVVELQGGMPIPVWAAYGEPHHPPALLVIPAYQPGREDDDPLDHKLTAAHYDGQEIPAGFKKLTWLDMLSEALFGTDQPPRYVILVGFKEWLLLDRYKWPNNRLLRFDWSEIFDRKEAHTLQAAAALLHHDSLAPMQGLSLLDSLDENAHKHAFGVSEDLKYALREAIELLGNEAVNQLRQKAKDSNKGFYTGKDAIDASDLSLECLRLVYRLLFMFYIEARPELGYVPIQKSETYAKGYSLESLRDLELTPLITPSAQNGIFFDATLRRLFTLIGQGCGASKQNALIAGSVKEAFTLAPLDSKLFDPTSTPMLNEVQFPNHIWQRVIRLMSLSGGKNRGRVSYQLLSINQLGAVYEALLSYRGFFAPEELYEVQPETKKVTKSSVDDEEDGDDSDVDGEGETLQDSAGSSTDMMDSAWFVPASRIDQYMPSERVHDIDDQGRKKLRVYPRDTFIYRLAGRDRQKSASYYTPQVLTQCLVKYALKELLNSERVKCADDILGLTVCEPAMGSAAFLNEAVNQLSEAYLERKQLELKRRIPHSDYTQELRVQLWLRELRRMVTQVRSDSQNIELRADSDTKREPGKLFLPLLQCADCHTTGWLSRMPNGQSKVSTDLDEIYSTWFSSQPETLRLYAQSGLTRPLCDGVNQHLCTQCGHLQPGLGDCIACGHADLISVFRVTATRTTTTQAGLAHVWHDPTCPACGSKFRQVLLGARNTTLGAITIEQSWASPFNDDKKLIAFSDSVQDAAHRAGFFTARTYLNTVRTGLAKVIDQFATPKCSWPSFLDHSARVWLDSTSPLYMPIDRFVSEFIGPNMMWQHDWAYNLQELNALPGASRLPERVQKRLAWQAFAEFTYLSRRGRNLEGIGKATLVPKFTELEAVAEKVLPELQEKFGIRHIDKSTVIQWLWGFVCHLRQRGAVVHPETKGYAKDGKIFGFSQTGGRKEWLPAMGDRSPHPLFLSLGKDRGYDHLVNPQASTFYKTWLSATLGANGLLAERSEEVIYGCAINALVNANILLRLTTLGSDAVGLNPEALFLDTEVVRLVSNQGKRGLVVPADSANALIGMPCLDAPQESYSHQVDASSWLSKRFSRGELRRVFSAEHTGLLQRNEREALELRFKTKKPHPWYENLLSATPTLEMGVDIGDLSSVMLCSVPPNQASYLQRIGRAGRRDGNAFATTLADGASPHDLYFFEDTYEMLSGEVVPPGIFLKAAEVLRRQMFAFCLDDWVGSGIVDTALPDKTKDALDARDSLDQSRFPYTFLEYIHTHDERLLGGFELLLGNDLDARVSARLQGFMQGTDEDDALRIRLSKVLDEVDPVVKTKAIVF